MVDYSTILIIVWMFNFQPSQTGNIQAHYMKALLNHPLFQIKSPPQKVLVFGDSHAEQYGPLISTVMKQEISIPTLFLTGGGCPPFPNVYSDNHPHCQDFMDRFHQVLSHYSTIDTIIIAACFNCYFIEETIYPKPKESKNSFYFKDEKGIEPFRGGDGKKRSIEKFSGLISDLSRNYHVVIILDNPLSNQFDPKVHIIAKKMPWNPYFAKKYPDFSLDGFTIDKVQLQLTEELQHVLGQHEVTLIDPNPIICPSNTCKSKDANGKPIYKDISHIRPFFVNSHFQLLNKFFVDNSD